MIDFHRAHGLFKNTDCTLLRYGIENSGADDAVVAVGHNTNDSQKSRLLFVGQLTAQKGALWLVDSINEMDRPDVRLDILGKGPQVEQIKKVAAGNESIHIHGFVTGDELNEFYKRADATIVSSKWYDNSPMVIYESYFQGTPVIGARIGGIPELIEEGKTGFLFDPDDRASLRRAIDSTIEADRETLRHGVEEARKRYTMDRHLEKLLTEYTKALR